MSLAVVGLEDGGAPTASLLDFWLRLGIAAICGGAIGWERERKSRPAGLRTHMLVAIGACAFTLLSIEIGERDKEVDPTRMLQGIIGGVGFLGAGAILQGREGVRGMTTAAGHWAVPAMGMAGWLPEGLLAISTTSLATLSLLHGVVGRAPLGPDGPVDAAPRNGDENRGGAAPP